MMPKKVLIVFVVILCSAYVAQTCTAPVYGEEGAQCDQNQRRYCQMDLFCNNSNVCGLVRYHKPCQGSGDCGFPYTDCINNKCDLKRYAGDKCENHTQCYSNTCVNGVCLGFAEGLPCNRGQCDKGLFCNQSERCAKSYVEGQLCTPSNGGGGPGVDAPLTCLPGLYCDTTRGICTRYKSLDTGFPCGNTLSCRTGLLCDGGTCRIRNSGCDHNFQCNNGNGAVCACTADLSAQGVCQPVVPTECEELEREYFDCIEYHDCPHTNERVWLPGSCANVHCNCERVKYERCVRAAHPEFYGETEPEWFQQDCTSGSSVITLSTITLVLLLLFVFY